jgi:Cft2 family RNA processing exonuclease
MPVFALGRAQELLLILDEYWRTHPEYHNIPIYYHGSLARKCMEVYRQYVHTMNANIRSRFDRGENAFSFMERSGKRGGGGRRGKTSFVQSVTHLGQVMNESKPCVVLASPGMLQSGASRDLMEKWAPDPKNGLLLTAYSVPNTLAWVGGVYLTNLEVGVAGILNCDHVYCRTSVTRTCRISNRSRTKIGKSSSGWIPNTSASVHTSIINRMRLLSTRSCLLIW